MRAYFVLSLGVEVFEGNAYLFFGTLVWIERQRPPIVGNSIFTVTVPGVCLCALNVGKIIAPTILDALGEVRNRSFVILFCEPCLSATVI